MGFVRQLAPFLSNVILREVRQYLNAQSDESSTDDALLPPLQLAPFPFDPMLRELRRYPNAQLICFVEF